MPKYGLTNSRRCDKIPRVRKRLAGSAAASASYPERSPSPQNRIFYTERYRSGHNEAVLKPPCHSGSNQRKSPVFEGNTRTFRTAKFFLLMFFLIQFHNSVYTEGYRSGHNEAVLKPPCHSGSDQRKSPVFAGDTRTFRTAKFFLLMFFLIQFHSSVYTEGYRSGHNEAVLKTV